MLKRKDLINRLSERGYTKSTSEKMIVDLFDVVSEALASGEDVRVQGFGAFELVTLKETRMTNISTDKREIVPSRTKVRFTPGEKLARAAKVNWEAV